MNLKSILSASVPIFLFLFLFSANRFAFAQEDQGPGTYKILSISTEGNKFYDSKTIIANSGLKIGSEITIPSDDTRNAIMRLWNLDLFSDIESVKNY